jgi:hypothetical protein
MEAVQHMGGSTSNKESTRLYFSSTTKANAEKDQ